MCIPPEDGLRKHWTFFFPKNYTVSEWKKFLQGNQFRLRWCLSTQKLWQGSNEKPWIPITNNLSINVWHFILLLFRKVVASSPLSVIDVPSVHSIQLKIIKTDTEENRNRWNRKTFIQKQRNSSTAVLCNYFQ